MAEQTMTWRIVRRAYSQYHLVEEGIASWQDAQIRSMDLQYKNKDGEYLVIRADAPNHDYSGPNYGQSPFDYL